MSGRLPRRIRRSCPARVFFALALGVVLIGVRADAAVGQEDGGVSDFNPEIVTEQTRADSSALARLEAPGQVFFTDGFEDESGFEGYLEVRGRDDGRTLRVQNADLVNSGAYSVQFTAPENSGNSSGSGGSLWFGPEGYDVVYFRRHIRFAPDYDQGNLNHTGGGLAGELCHQRPATAHGGHVAVHLERHVGGLHRRVDLGQLGGSALTANIDVPKHASADDLSEGIPVTYVPARNTIFLSYGLAVAETRGASHLFIGVNSVDYSGYPDCRPEYLAAFQAMANLATKQAVEEKHGVIIDAPLITLSKAEIIKAGNELGVDYSLTISCYDPGGDGVSCGHCDACLLRRQGFTDNGLVDPIPYQGQ